MILVGDTPETQDEAQRIDADAYSEDIIGAVAEAKNYRKAGYENVWQHQVYNQSALELERS